MLTNTSLSRNHAANASEVLNSPHPANDTQSRSKGSRRVGAEDRDNNLMTVVQMTLPNLKSKNGVERCDISQLVVAKLPAEVQCCYASWLHNPVNRPNGCEGSPLLR